MCPDAYLDHGWHGYDAIAARNLGRLQDILRSRDNGRLRFLGRIQANRQRSAERPVKLDENAHGMERRQPHSAILHAEFHDPLRCVWVGDGISRVT